jgi:hypothetical protein
VEDSPSYRVAMLVTPPATYQQLQARAEIAETKLTLIRSMATRSVPNCINLTAIDAILASK